MSWSGLTKLQARIRLADWVEFGVFVVLKIDFAFKMV